MGQYHSVEQPEAFTNNALDERFGNGGLEGFGVLNSTTDIVDKKYVNFADFVKSHSHVHTCVMDGKGYCVAAFDKSHRLHAFTKPQVAPSGTESLFDVVPIEHVPSFNGASRGSAPSGFNRASMIPATASPIVGANVYVAPYENTLTPKDVWNMVQHSNSVDGKKHKQILYQLYNNESKQIEGLFLQHTFKDKTTMCYVLPMSPSKPMTPSTKNSFGNKEIVPIVVPKEEFWTYLKHVFAQDSYRMGCLQRQQRMIDH